MTRVPIALCLLFACPAAAAEPPKLATKLETADPPKELAGPVRALFDDRAVIVLDAAGEVCTLWLRKDIPAAATATERKAGLTYQAVGQTAIVGAIRLARPWTDFRTQEAPAGIYTLRFVLQPVSKDHEGTAPHREFCVLSPAAADPKPDPLPLKKLVAQSGTITGGTHPVVMLLMPHPKPGAEPAIIRKGKAVAVGVRAVVKVGDEPAELGFAFTLAGVWTD
ncbi:MAG TPA: hypothetical protein VKE40_15595 [Gemmataceae bacterium]|nr:hypothetical protein [Gemmataceae bacterium]